jgi:diaminohydroxyphosphoribosylaminopyrimidine deaminase / 5-amino-6-(5-phosphoribosylamino)uracil reductase
MYFCGVKIHEKYINRCIAFAKNGLTTAMPNPAVGAVVVYNDVIIGEGFTAAYGGAHAEVNAINAVKDKSLLSKATLYVSLEPCSHFGKTPPCSDLILAMNIPNIVVGTLDSNSLVSGKGIQKLIDAGRNVTVGVLEYECRNSNKRFFCFHEKKRPYVILKWAATQDNFIAPVPETRLDARKPVWISNKHAQQLVHKWRSEEQAILIGVNTVLADNPKLDVRLWIGKNPIRVILDPNNKIPSNSFVLDDSCKTIVLVTKKIKPNTSNTFFETIDFKHNVAHQVLDVLYGYGIQSVLIEGGAKTLETFIEAKLWDEARIFKSNIQFKQGVPAPFINGSFVKNEALIDNVLTYIENR